MERWMEKTTGPSAMVIKLNAQLSSAASPNQVIKFNATRRRDDERGKARRQGDEVTRRRGDETRQRDGETTTATED
jgi:hypothetical protein